MKKGSMIFLICFSIIILSLSFASASWLGDFWNKITGHVFSASCSVGKIETGTGSARWLCVNYQGEDQSLDCFGGDNNPYLGVVTNGWTCGRWGWECNGVGYNSGYCCNGVHQNEECPTTFTKSCENYYGSSWWPSYLPAYDSSLLVACDNTLVTCPNQNDAVYNGKCYSSSTYKSNFHRAVWKNVGFSEGNDKIVLSYNINGNPDSQYFGKWIDCDTEINHCAACDNEIPTSWATDVNKNLDKSNNIGGIATCVGAQCWVKSGETSVGEYKVGATGCCGDDNNEYFIDGVCCDGPNDVNQGGKCVTKITETTPTTPSCGDLTCAGTETCSTCPGDCGDCTKANGQSCTLGNQCTSSFCKGITCDGFCYVSDSVTENLCYKGEFFEYPKKIDERIYEGLSCQSDYNCPPGFNCINQMCFQYLWENPYRLPIDITPIYPKSVQLNSDFNLTLIFKNNGVENINISITRVIFFRFANSGYGNDVVWVPYKEEKDISPKSETRFDIPLHAFSKESMTSSISVSVGVVPSMYSNLYFNLIVKPIIIYNPSFEKQCNDKKYDSRNAVCVNDILFPTFLYSSCIEDSDCDTAYRCMDYSCINSNPIFEPNREYKVIIPKIFIYDNDFIFESEKDQKINELNEIIDSSNTWFTKEKDYWNTNSPFTVKYISSDGYCRLTKQDYLVLLGESENGYEFYKNLIKKCNIVAEDHIIAIHEFWQDDLLDEDIFTELRRLGIPGVVGLNYAGEILIFGLDSGVLIHETLHSFGEPDLYLESGSQNAFFQQRNCHLFKAQWEEFSKFPHLCEFEAKIIGWSGNFENIKVEKGGILYKFSNWVKNLYREKNITPWEDK